MFSLIVEGVYIQNARIRQMVFCHPFLQQRFFETKYLSSISTDFQVDQARIEELFNQEDAQQLRQSVDQSLEFIGRDASLGRSAAEKLIRSWMQMTFLYLRKKHVDAERLFGTETYQQLYEKAADDLKACRIYLHYLINQSIACSQELKASNDIIEQIKRYIDDHLANRLSKAELAEIGYLNADYMAHLFRETTGVSLVKYINGRRLSKAKELLELTDDPVYAIALQTGFPTTSYFAKQFKDVYLITPSEYRGSIQHI